MGLFHYLWSRTAASNATADTNVNWQEGMAPSAVNDSARAMMASLAGYRDDIAGAITTGGTSTAYTVTSYQVFDSLAHLNGQMLAFVPHTTNTGACTLNVDGLGAAPIRQFRNVELTAGVLIQGTPYLVVYNSSAGEFNLHNSFGNPYNIPIGASIDYWGSTAPNSSFVLSYGQAISRTTYSSLFSLFGTTYGSGDGSTTFNIPDLRGRVVAGKGDMGGSDAGRLSSAYLGASPSALGAAGGSESRSLSTSNMPPYTPSGSISGTSVLGWSVDGYQPPGGGSKNAVNGIAGVVGLGNSTTTALSGTFTGSPQGGTSTAFGILQPTIIANKLIRII